MLIKIIKTPAVAGGRAVVLCDDEGEILPSQRATILETGVGELPTITVTFAVDGDSIRFAD